MNKYELLYQLLKERDDTINVYHKVLPSYYDHCNFVDNHPYKAWYIIEDVGAIHLDQDDSIGIAILKKYQGQGYGLRALQALLLLHPRPKYYALINKKNHKSRQLFAKFKNIEVKLF